MNQSEPPRKTDSWLGSKVLNRYQINRCVGEGGMGIVYEAEDLNLKRRVAIKRLNDYYATNQQALALFTREAMAASRVGNEHVIHVNDIVATHSPPFMVLEFLEGSNLDTYVTTVGAPPLRTVARIITQVCDALEAVHAQGIIHRDLKPDNIYLIHRGANPEFVKVIDFGVARIRSSFGGLPTSGSVPGQMVGTLQYMSPEQLRGAADIDHRTDIYALGAVLFFSLTSTPLYNADSVLQIVEMITKEPPPSISQWRGKDLPSETITELDRIISKALEKNRENRYQSALDFKRELWPFSDQLEYQFSVPPGPPRSIVTSVPPAGISRWTVPLSVAVLTGAAFAIGSFAMTRGDTSKVKPISVVRPSPSSTEPLARNKATSELASKNAQPASAMIRISTDPVAARLFLDAKPVSNPFVGQLVKDKSPHTVRAELYGYMTASRRFIANDDQTIPLTLLPTSASDSEKPAGRKATSLLAPSVKAAKPPVASSEVSVSSKPPVTVETGPTSTPSTLKETEKKNESASSSSTANPPPPPPPPPKPAQTAPSWKTTEPLDESRIKIIR
jgi:eukaryotic-like serine/threonine-protein kinase